MDQLAIKPVSSETPFWLGPRQLGQSLARAALPVEMVKIRVSTRIEGAIRTGERAIEIILRNPFEQRSGLAECSGTTRRFVENNIMARLS